MKCKVGDFIEIPAHYDLWMQGAQFGVIKDIKDSDYLIKLDNYDKIIKVDIRDMDQYGRRN